MRKSAYLTLLFALNLIAETDIPEKPVGNKQILDYLWQKSTSTPLEHNTYYELIKSINEKKLTIVERVYLKNIEKNFIGRTKSMPEFIQKLSHSEALSFLSLESFFELDSYDLGREVIKQLDSLRTSLTLMSETAKMSESEITTLFYDETNLSEYKNGKYEGVVKLFLFCRKDRRFPCLFMMKDVVGNTVRSEGELWSLSALAKSATNREFSKVNGHTPTGVYRMDSVMPYANKKQVYGNFRRVILNWIPKKNNSIKYFLPKEHLDLNWWKQASIARDAGRSYLRIHGTGRVNKNKKLPYYPHTPTLGCISMREGEYDEHNFIDQRKILDIIMISSFIPPLDNYEKKIRGVLYVVNIDDKKSAVKLHDLEELGITY